MSYDVVDPDKLHLGKSYSNYVEDWFNWYLSADADKRNLGPVVFLRTSPIPANKGVDSDAARLNVTNAYTDDPSYDRPYDNLPNVRVGGDRLQIRKDQAVFIPIIVAYEVAVKPYYDWGLMQEITGLMIDNGDDPPKATQLKIDSQAVNIADLKRFRIMTSVFTAIVPEADYGRSIKDFLEVSVNPGQYAAIVEGYFVLIRNLAPGHTYVVHSRASSGRERGGAYVAELLYEITVENRSKKTSEGEIPFDRTSRNEAIINRLLTEKVEKGELTEPQRKKIF